MYDYCIPDLTAGHEERAERAEFFRLLRVAAGATARDWVMSDDADRVKIHRRGLLRLVHAAGWLMPDWRRLYGFARVAVLLVGARVLGIRHCWRGPL